MSKQLLPHISKASDNHPNASIIWLHGLGADGYDFEPIVEQLHLPDDFKVRFIFPHAPSMPVSINGGFMMPAWYDIRHQDINMEHDKHGIEKSADAIQLFIQREIERGIAPSRIFLAGFSQGAAMALYVGIRQKEALAGIIALSGYVLTPNDVVAPQQTSNIFLGHGVNDGIVPIALGMQAQTWLKAQGNSVDWHSYPMEHSVCPQEIQDIRSWIIAHL